jgi:hypothetical protein
MFSSLPDLQKERGFPFTPSRKKKLLKSKRESTLLFALSKSLPNADTRAAHTSPTTSTNPSTSRPLNTAVAHLGNK